MVNILNKTDHDFVVLPCTEDNTQHLLVIKKSFLLEENGTFSPAKNSPISTNETWKGEPFFSALENANECLVDPDVAIFITGDFVPFQKITMHSLSIALRQKERTWQKDLKLYGKRSWQSVFKNYAAPLPIEKVSLDASAAFGGKQEEHYYPQNPAGKGYVKKGLTPFLPELVDPQNEKFPVLLGPIPAAWKIGGGLPQEAVESFIHTGKLPHQPAAQKKTSSLLPPFQGGDMLLLKGFFPSPVECMLPSCNLSLVTETTQIPFQYDTLHLDITTKVCSFLARLVISEDTLGILSI
jgi:hypothetical protein